MLHLCSFVQIILALGNYMNSSKRGSVYGFKLQSLDLVWLMRPIKKFYFMKYLGDLYTLKIIDNIL